MLPPQKAVFLNKSEHAFCADFTASEFGTKTIGSLASANAALASSNKPGVANAGEIGGDLTDDITFAITFHEAIFGSDEATCSMGAASFDYASFAGNRADFKGVKVKCQGGASFKMAEFDGKEAPTFATADFQNKDGKTCCADFNWARCGSACRCAGHHISTLTLARLPSTPAPVPLPAQ